MFILIVGCGRVGSSPDCLRVGADLHCFVATPTGSLAVRTHRAGTWLAWQDLGGQVKDRPACRSSDGRRLDCVVLGPDGRLRWRSREARRRRENRQRQV